MSVVEFLFSQCRKPDEKEQRLLPVLFESITLNKIESANGIICIFKGDKL